jgi:hypothetical protein
MKKTGLIIALMLSIWDFHKIRLYQVSFLMKPASIQVNVSLKNSTKGSTTDLDGKYLFSDFKTVT